MKHPHLDAPAVVSDLTQAAATLGFTLSSDPFTGSLLRTLAASRPAGEILELGTGVGMGTAWLLAGMDQAAHLTTVDRNEETTAVARRFLGANPRVTFQLVDGTVFIQTCQEQGRVFDLIFADTHPGKFEVVDETLSLLKPGGMYIVDDLLPQPKWAVDHPPKVEQLINLLESREDLFITRIDWSVGLLLAVKR